MPWHLKLLLWSTVLVGLVNAMIGIRHSLQLADLAQRVAALEAPLSSPVVARRP